MPTFLSDLLAQMKGIWGRLDAGQRMTVSVVLLATVVGLGSIVWFAGRPDYQVAFSSLESRELMEAARSLDQGGIGYDIEGSSLVVDRTDMDAARRALLAGGIGAGGATPSDLASMTSDRATRMHTLSRLVERDAARKLKSIRGVLVANVSHSKPQRSPYRMLDKETQPRANVGLRVASGVSFSAVAHAATQEAAAALGIPPEYITVTNLANGQVFTEDQGANAGGSFETSDFLRQQRLRSADLTQQAQTLLDRIYPDRAVVRVSVVLDPEWRVLRERSAPDKQMIKRTVTTKENSTDPGRSSGGDPSASGTIGTAASAGASSQKKESKETEYIGDGYKETSSGRLAPDVKQMTVALVIDEELAPDAAAEQKIQALVKNAIGWSDEWGGAEAFTIHRTAIPELEMVDDSSLPGLMGLAERYGPVAAQVAAVLLVLLFLRGLLKKGPAGSARGRSTAGAAAGSRPVLSPVGGGGAGGSADVGDEGAAPEEATRRMRMDIEEVIAKDPATVSRLLESWLLENQT